MGLKDQLIQQMNEGKDDKAEETFSEEVEDTLNEAELFGETDEETDEGEDLSDIFSNETEAEEPVEAVIDIPDAPDNDEPVFDEEVVEETEEEDFYEPEPAPKKSRGRQARGGYKGYGYGDSMDNSELEAALLNKSKETILLDIEERYESELFTKPLIAKLIDGYLNNKDSGVSNSDAIFTSVIDEVLNSDYQHDYYKDLVADILESVKSHIN